MENLKIGEGPLKLNYLVNVMKDSSSFQILLDRWKSFGRDIGVNEAKIVYLADLVLIRNVKLHDIPYELLCLWKADKGTDATLKTLCDSLDNNEMGDISETLKERFWLDAAKSLKINLHDGVTTLGEIVDQASEETYRSIYATLQRSTYLQPIPLLRADVVPKVPENYYVPRSLSYTNQLNEKIFTDKSMVRHLFLVKGISTSELAKLSGFKPVEMTGNQFDEITVRFMVLERDEDFDSICKIANDPVHLIEHQNNSYFWVKSSRDIHIIQEFLMEKSVIYSEDSLLEKISATPTSKAVIISDSAGMGKSFLLASLASKFKHESKSIVVYIVLNEFSQQSQRLQHIDSSTEAIATIIEYGGANDVSKIILDTILKNAGQQVDLFLDSYDEVIQDRLNIVDAFLKHANGLENFRIFVTTRPHLRPQLENILSELSYEILPFDESNQIDFLSNYWIHKHNAEVGERVVKYAKKCLQTLRGQMTDMEQDIAGIPLQCRLLAEVYGDDAERASRMDSESTETIKITSLFVMYKTLIDSKFQRVPEVPKKYLSINYWKGGNPKKNYINAHVHDSIKLLFPDWIDKFKSHLKGHREIDANTLYSIGLIERSPHVNMPRFVHRTFAEYIFAEFLIGSLSEYGESVELLFGNILGGNGVLVQPFEYKFNYPVISYFVNMHLKELTKNNPMDQLGTRILRYQNKLHFENICQAMAACGSHDFKTSFDLANLLFKHLHSHHANPEYLVMIRDRYFKYLPHLVVGNSKSVTLVEKVLDTAKQKFRVGLSYHVYDEIKDFYNYPWIHGCTPLHLAVYLGKYNIVTYLVTQYGDQIVKLDDLVGICTVNSSGNGDSVVQNKIAILGVLGNVAHRHNLNWLDHALLAANADLRLLQQLVELGSNINTAVETVGTVLHTSCSIVNYDDLIRWALSKGFSLVNYCDEEGKTPLIKTMQSAYPVSIETLELFYEAGAKFDALDVFGDSVLFYAAITQTTTVMEKVIECGANVNHQNARDRNVAHVIVETTPKCHAKNLEKAVEKLKLIISKGFNLLNAPDFEGVTPFILMMNKFLHFDNPELFQLFQYSGVDFNTRVSKMFGIDQTVLIHVISTRSFASIGKLIECGADVNDVDATGNTAAHAVICSFIGYPQLDSEEIIKVLNLLILNGFTKIDHSNINGITPLFAAMRLRNLDLKLLDFFHEQVANFAITRSDTQWSLILSAITQHHDMSIMSKLIEYGANLHGRGEYNSNALHIALYSKVKDFRVLQFLINHFHVNSSDDHGQTPLHYLVIRKLNRNFNLHLQKNRSLGNVIGANQERIKNVMGHGRHRLIETKVTAVDFEIDDWDMSLFQTKLRKIVDHIQKDSTLTSLVPVGEGKEESLITTFFSMGYRDEKGSVSKELLDFLAANQADFNAVDHEGWSVLFRALQFYQDSTVISKLMDYGADLYHLSIKKNNALHAAAASGNDSAINVVLDKFDINTPDDDGRSPLHFLVLTQKLDPKLLDMFHERGANFNMADIMGQTPLFYAIRKNQNAGIIQKILEYGGDLNHLDLDRVNAFHAASISGNFPVLEYLVDKIDINSTNGKGQTPLHYLVASKDLDPNLIDFYHENGANFNAVDDSGWSVLFSALEHSHNPMVISKLLDYGADLYFHSVENMNALHVAAFTGIYSIVRIIINEFDINSIDVNGYTPLHFLLIPQKGADQKLLELLHETGANFNATDNNGLPILFHAILTMQKAAVIRKIVEYGADLCYLRPDGSNALHFAASFRNFSALEFLIDKFDINSADAKGYTPLHTLVIHGKESDLKLLELFYKNGANFNVPDNKGMTILFHAMVANKDMTVSNKLLEFGADLYHLNSWKANALHITAFQGNLSYLEFLMDKFDVNSVDDKGLVPLHYAFLYEDTVDPKLLDLFHQKGANFNATDNDNLSVLFYAILKSQSTLIINRIIEYGGNPSHEFVRNRTVMHLAANMRNLRVVELLSNVLDINAPDEDGFTPLHFIVRNEDALDLKSLEVFKSKGANFNAVNKKGQSVLFYAIERKQNPSVIRKLVEHGAQLYYVRPEEGTNALHCAAFYRNYSALEFLLTKFDINSTDFGGRTSLHYLFLELIDVDPKLLDLLHGQGADFNASENIKALSPIFYAIDGKQNSMIFTKLLACGANLYHLTTDGENLLHYAAIRRSTSALEFFIDKLDINSKDGKGLSPLHHLLVKDEPLDPNLIDLFYKKHAHFNAKSDLGKTILWYAIKCQHDERVIGKLLGYGADINHCNATQATALHIAAEEGNRMTIEFFLDKIGNNINSVDMEGNTPLHYLLSKQQELDPALLDLFHKRGANFNAEDTNGNSILFHAIRHHQNLAIIRKILDNGADLYHCNLKNANALHMAAYFRHFSVTEYLLDEIDLNFTVAKGGMTPLHYLVQNGGSLDLKLLELFHSKGVNFNALTAENASVLFYAISCNCNAMTISKIIELGGDPNHLDHQKNNVFHVASKHANSSALKFLMDKFDDIDTVNDSGNSPLHEVFSLNNKDYRGVLSLLLRSGCNFGIKNRKGYTPLVQWIIEGTNPLPTLLDMQDLLPLTRDTASSALTASVQQQHLLQQQLSETPEQKNEAFTKFFNLLISRGAKILMHDGSNIEWEKVNEGSFAIFDQIIVDNEQLEQYLSKTFSDSMVPHTTNWNFSFLIKQANVPIELLLQGLLSTKQYHLFQSLCLALDGLIL